MKDKINSILSEAKGKISDAVSEGELQNVKSAYIGKQGSLSLLMKEIPTVDVALRPEMGKLLNQAKNEVKDLIDEKRMELKLKASEVSPDLTVLFRVSCRQAADFTRSRRCVMT